MGLPIERPLALRKFDEPFLPLLFHGTWERRRCGRTPDVTDDGIVHTRRNYARTQIIGVLPLPLAFRLTRSRSVLGWGQGWYLSEDERITLRLVKETLTPIHGRQVRFRPGNEPFFFCDSGWREIGMLRGCPLRTLSHRRFIPVCWRTIKAASYRISQPAPGGTS